MGLRTFYASDCRAAQEDHAAAGKDEGGLSPVERYCRELESTACWGGQLELSVLAQVRIKGARVSSSVLLLLRAVLLLGASPAMGCLAKDQCAQERGMVGLPCSCTSKLHLEGLC